VGGGRRGAPAAAARDDGRDDMPLGGFCEICDRWVWLTPYGACENGHPATAVRDVQQLKPSASVGVVPYEGEYAPFSPGKARLRFWWRHSLWIGWTFTLGFCNWLAFVYVGIRARHAAWTIAGFAYLVPLILTIASFSTPLFRDFLALQIFVSAVSVAHAMYIRPYYRAVMFGDAPRRAVPAPPQDPRLLPPAERPALPHDVDGAAAEVIETARREVDTIRETAGAIGKRDVQDKVVHLCASADDILNELVARPAKVAAARGFLTYYLEAAKRIVDGYALLAARPTTSPDIATALTRAEASLDSVQTAFDGQLAAVLEDRVLDLESEIELLERTVRMDDYYSQTGGLSGQETPQER
jgi:hypothetical protein